MTQEATILKHVEDFVDSSMEDKNNYKKLKYAEGYFAAMKSVKKTIVFGREVYPPNRVHDALDD